MVGGLLHSYSYRCNISGLTQCIQEWVHFYFFKSINITKNNHIHIATVVWEKFDIKKFLSLVWHDKNWTHEIFLTMNKKGIFYSLETPRDENISPQTNFTRKYPMLIFLYYTYVCSLLGQVSQPLSCNICPQDFLKHLITKWVVNTVAM